MTHPSLPPFNTVGDLPIGVHRASIEAVIDRFGRGGLQRRAVADRLRRIHQLARSTGHLARFIVFGSFVTSKPAPNDVDIQMVMEDAFESTALSGDAALVFQHLEADSHFGASVFWTKRSGAFGGEQNLVEHWQRRRDGGRRGIVEIVEDEP